MVARVGSIDLAPAPTCEPSPLRDAMKGEGERRLAIGIDVYLLKAVNIETSLHHELATNVRLLEACLAL
jgi:hypothetical protein